MYATICLTLLWLLASATPLHAGTFYVSTNGNDSKPGTAAAPFRTVQRGVSALKKGDTLVIEGGASAEGDLTPPSGVTIRSAPGERAILKPGRPLDSIISYLDGVSHVTLDGLVIDGGGAGDERLVRFPLFTNEGHSHLTLKNSEVKNSFFSCLLISGAHWDIRNNHIHHCGMDKTYDHGVYFSGNHSLIVGNRYDPQRLLQHPILGRAMPPTIPTRATSFPPRGVALWRVRVPTSSFAGMSWSMMADKTQRARCRSMWIGCRWWATPLSM